MMKVASAPSRGAEQVRGVVPEEAEQDRGGDAAAQRADDDPVVGYAHVLPHHHVPDGDDVAQLDDDDQVRRDRVPLWQLGDEHRQLWRCSRDEFI